MGSCAARAKFFVWLVRTHGGWGGREGGEGGVEGSRLRETIGEASSDQSQLRPGPAEEKHKSQQISPQTLAATVVCYCWRWRDRGSPVSRAADGQNGSICAGDDALFTPGLPAGVVFRRLSCGVLHKWRRVNNFSPADVFFFFSELPF